MQAWRPECGLYNGQTNEKTVIVLVLSPRVQVLQEDRVNISIERSGSGRRGVLSRVRRYRLKDEGRLER